MKIIRDLSKGILFITIPFILVIINANILTTTPYLNLSKGIYDSHDDIYYNHDYAIERIIGYLNYRYDDLYFGIDAEDDNVIMRDIEIRHMVDVKNVYTGLRLAALGSFILMTGSLMFLYKNKKNEIINTLDKMWIGPLFFILFVGGYIVIDFDTAFTVFHKLFFTNNDWILRSDDVLILLLPTTFWMVSGIIILIGLILELFGIYWLNNKFLKKRLQ
ncbi:MAG: TIGR01906 family membrane protein [Candidatus Izemoplasma sp.]|nr:TIGR01906 family membrane protein [Candidatus Izemoplasma sp.]